MKYLLFHDYEIHTHYCFQDCSCIDPHHQSCYVYLLYLVKCPQYLSLRYCFQYLYCDCKDTHAVCSTHCCVYNTLKTIHCISVIFSEMPNKDTFGYKVHTFVFSRPHHSCYRSASNFSLPSHLDDRNHHQHCHHCHYQCHNHSSSSSAVRICTMYMLFRLPSSAVCCMYLILQDVHIRLSE